MSKISGFASFAAVDPALVSTLTTASSSVPAGSGVTTSVSTSSPLPFIPVPQEDRGQIHHEDHDQQHHDRGRREGGPLIPRLPGPVVDDRRERRVFALER